MDIRENLFERIESAQVTACIYTDMDGVVSGIANALKKAEDIGLTVEYSAEEGSEVFAGDLIMQIKGSPIQICIAEDTLIGCISKPSGVATMARAFVRKAGGSLQVVCGAWKKMPREMKEQLRAAAVAGGVCPHITDEPMIYLDKNYVRMFNGIQACLSAAMRFTDRKKAIQIKGQYEDGDIVREAWAAITSGADIVFVDTGSIEDLKCVTERLKPTLEHMREQDNYREVRFAFGGGISLDEVDTLIDAGADVIDVGRSIVDAPLMDLRLDVTGVEQPDAHAGYSLLDKSELVIHGITLEQTNLTELAAVTAEVIGIRSEDVMVIDVRDGTVALDILQSCLDPSRFVAKEKTLLDRLSKLEGVTLQPNAGISSDGMLGWIADDGENSAEKQNAIASSVDLGAQIAQIVSRRVIVFPTGTEVEAGEIEDTNTPLVMQKFAEAGFTVDKGEILKDDVNLLFAKLRQASEKAYGVSVTTGGVGAENKDHSVEAVLMLDENACTPYIAKFQSGSGRHSKEGIRIAVGQSGLTTYIALPGPHDEVALCVDTVVKGISEGWSKEVLANELAKLLRSRLKEKIGIIAGNHEHKSNSCRTCK